MKAGGATRLQMVHQWVYSHGLWRCTTCAKYSWGNEQQGPVCDTACGGPKELVQGPRMAELGHVILVGRLEGVPVRFCARCGARASWKSVLLARKCRGHPASQATESLLRRLRAGVDPRTKKPLIDVLPLNAFLRKLAEPVKVEVKGPEQKSEADNMDVEATGSEVEVVPWQPLRASGDTLVAAPGRWWEQGDPPSARRRAGRRYAKKELWKGTGVSDGAMRVVRLAPLTRKGGKAGGRRQPLGEPTSKVPRRRGDACRDTKRKATQSSETTSRRRQASGLQPEDMPDVEEEVAIGRSSEIAPSRPVVQTSRDAEVSSGRESEDLSRRGAKRDAEAVASPGRRELTKEEQTRLERSREEAKARRSRKAEAAFGREADCEEPPGRVVKRGDGPEGDPTEPLAKRKAEETQLTPAQVRLAALKRRVQAKEAASAAHL